MQNTTTTTIDPRDLNLLSERVVDLLNHAYFFPSQVTDAAVRAALPAFLAQLGVQVITAPPAPATRRPRRSGLAFLDKGGADGQDDTSDVPPAVHAVAAERLATYRAAHGGHYPPAPFDAGANSERASVGLPGHCSVCAILGHVTAHPELGCGDVRCDSDHTGPGQISRHTCTSDGKAQPFGRKAPIGQCLRCDQLRLRLVKLSRSVEVNPGS